MSAEGLFVIGVLVTAILGLALGLLIYAAILDGRYAAARRLAQQQAEASETDRPDAERGIRVAA